MGRIVKNPLGIAIIIKHPETEMFADELVNCGLDVQKFYLSCKLKDENSFVLDELELTNSFMIIDSIEGAFLAERCKLNNAVFILLDARKDETEIIKKNLDFKILEVKDYETKTRNDWTEAALFFKQEISESLDSGSNL